MLPETLPFLADQALEAPMPTIDAMYIVGIASRVLHILGAIILAGGLFYLKAVLAPKGPDACFADRRGIWAKWVGIASLLLIATGLYNYLAITGAIKEGGVQPPKTYHMLFGIKFLLALFVMFIGSILAGRTEAADKFRAAMPKWLNLGWAAILAIVVIAAVMRSMSVPLLK